VPIFLKQALAAARLLAADERQADHVVGLHAQQAVEKSLKAVLASREVEIPLTHDLGYIVALCSDSMAMPEDALESHWLTPWAGGWRYDTEASPIDSALALSVAESALRWSRMLIDTDGRAARSLHYLSACTHRSEHLQATRRVSRSSAVLALRGTRTSHRPRLPRAGPRPE